MKTVKTIFAFTVIAAAVAGLCVWAYGLDNSINKIRKYACAPKSTEEIVAAHSETPHAVRVSEGETITIVGFKDTQTLYVFKSESSERASYSLIRKYPFKGFSGRLGPKLREGDRQIPEGIYGVDFLNPNSAYHLSFRIAYPNRFEKQKAREEGRDVNNLGSNIMIHGGSLTIGCIPIGNDEIEELFAWVGIVKKENVKVVLAPTNFLDKNSGEVIKNIRAPKWYPELCRNLKNELETMHAKGAKF